MEISSRSKRLRHSSRGRRTRLKLRAGGKLPRLSVFRSGRHIYAQIIDDAKGITLAFASDIVGKKGAAKKDTKRGVLSASSVGESIAKSAIDKKIGTVVFDRGGYKYHGRVRALADAARKAGLKF